jgi:hypothetical protein
MSNVKGRVAKLEGQVGPLPPEPQEPLTEEEHYNGLVELLAEANAEIDTTRQTGGLNAKGRLAAHLQLAQYAEDTIADLGELSDEPPAVSNPLRALIRFRDHYEQNKQGVGDVQCKARRAAELAKAEAEADIEREAGETAAAPLGDDVGEIETLPASPGPSAPPETPSPEPSPVPPSRKPSIVSESGLRPCKWVTGPWR